MNKRGFQYVFGLVGLTLVVGLACSSLSSTAAAPTAAPIVTAASAPTQAPEPTTGGGNASTVTFTDQSNYFAIDVPSGWKHTQEVDKQNNYWYWDVLTSPDGNAKIESVVYNDGTPWTGSQNGKMALTLLNQFYSSTGKEGDIRVSSDSIQKDGSERLDWTSKGGSYSGESFFEVRNRMAFLMFTIWWSNDHASQYETTLDNVVSSYRIP